MIDVQYIIDRAMELYRVPAHERSKRTRTRTNARGVMVMVMHALGYSYEVIGSALGVTAKTARRLLTTEGKEHARQVCHQILAEVHTRRDERMTFT